MNEQMNEKKIRWNIPKAMACVYQALKESKLKIKKTKPYTTAMENLKTLYNLNQTQLWLLCIICENYFEEEDSTSMKDVSYTLKVPLHFFRKHLFNIYTIYIIGNIKQCVFVLVTDGCFTRNPCWQ